MSSMCRGRREVSSREKRIKNQFEIFVKFLFTIAPNSAERERISLLRQIVEQLLFGA